MVAALMLIGGAGMSWLGVGWYRGTQKTRNRPSAWDRGMLVGLGPGLFFFGLVLLLPSSGAIGAVRNVLGVLGLLSLLAGLALWVTMGWLWRPSWDYRPSVWSRYRDSRRREH
jgi:hypothetical protein